MMTLLLFSDRVTPKLQSCETWLQEQIESLTKHPPTDKLPVLDWCQLKPIIQSVRLFSVSMVDKKKIKYLISLSECKQAYIHFSLLFPAVLL